MDIIVKHYGVIDLSNEMVISDPCYDNDSFGHRFKPAEDSQGSHLFDIYVGFDKHELRPAYLSINLIDEEFSDTAMRYSGCCYVDSGTMGIYTAKLFDDVRKSDERHDVWYKKTVCNDKYEPFFADNDESFILPSGYGDGTYPVSLDFDEDGKFYRLVINFIEPNVDDEYESVSFIDQDTDAETEKKEIERGILEDKFDMAKEIILNFAKEEIRKYILDNYKPKKLLGLYDDVFELFMLGVLKIEREIPNFLTVFEPEDYVYWYDDFRGDMCRDVQDELIEKYFNKK